MAGLPERAGVRIPVLLHHGVTRAGKQARLLLTGRAFAPLYFSKRFFAAPPQVEPLGAVRLGRLAQCLDEWRMRADLTITCVDHRSSRRLFGNDWLLMPAWVASELSLPTTTVEMARLSKRLSNRTRQYMRHQIDIMESTDTSDLAQFHQRHYLPYARTRHGEMAGMRPPWKLRWRFRHEGRVFWALQDGRRVGGMLVLRLGDGLKLECLGVLDGREDLMRQGVLSLLYAHSIRHAIATGCRRVLFGNSRPSLQDGVLNFKRNWGASLLESASTHYEVLMRWNSTNDVMEEFLSHTSLIHRDGHDLSVLWAFPDDSAHFVREFSMIQSPGVRRVRVLSRAPLAHDRVLPAQVDWLDVHTPEIADGSFVRAFHPCT
jgi:hypothetical protein